MSTVKHSFPDTNRESYCSVSPLTDWSLCSSFEREIVSNGKPTTRILRALRRIWRRTLQQFALYLFKGCCFSKTNLTFKTAVFKIMTAYALRTMQSVPLECRYVPTRLHQLYSILPFTLVQSLEHINRTTCFVFSLLVRLFCRCI